ncbi:hypothetical protein P691DRAFT_791812 [Macrolepiota fuliginosa MF-IS2]|uniref:2'-phosphotransferase n=1 Tax=Macrolepiota fuliginosa MF-IS2 TaxID=1400762 RepID=A0A9P5X0B1_9AGAR|nr:hypothetical protein P691DRAFT_791812 [Macrolepiota fuliginosa MF-IS2]
MHNESTQSLETTQGFPGTGEPGLGAGPSRSGTPNVTASRGSQKLDSRDKPDLRLSKTISWPLRHSAASEGLVIRVDGADGYVKVDDPMLAVQERSDTTPWPNPRAAERDSYGQGMELLGTGKGAWLIKENQGHPLKYIPQTIQVEFESIQSESDIPSGLVVHGTTGDGWATIQEGPEKTRRDHLAQGVGDGTASDTSPLTLAVISAMHVRNPLDAGVKYHLSDNRIVLTKGGRSRHWERSSLIE